MIKPETSTIPAGGRAFWRADLPRWRQLVQARWLCGLVSGETVTAVPAGDWRLFEVGEGSWCDARAPAIPGAAWLDVQQFESGPLWNLVPDGLLLQRIAALGIRHDTTVVLAGRKRVASARVAHLLLFAGVSDVRLLDGGTQAWVQAGLPLTRTAPIPLEPLPNFGLKEPACPQYLLDTAQAKALGLRPNATLASIRTWAEFTGRTSGYDYIAARGDIPGARWGHAGADGDVNDMSAYHTPAGLMLAAADIATLWRSQGITPDRHTAFYCGTGWRASLAFFYAWLMGWERIGVYDGGWLEWSSDPANPVINRQAIGETAAVSDCSAALP